MLVTYFGRLAPMIRDEFDGEVAEFVGDQIFAVFNKAGDQPDHALRAARAGLALQRVAAEIRADAGIPTGRTSAVGINTGEVLAGVVGDRGHRIHGVFGDTVNLGSRLEGQSPVDGVMIGAATYEQLPAGTRRRAPARPAGQGQGRAGRRLRAAERAVSDAELVFESLDYVYVPTADVDLAARRYVGRARRGARVQGARHGHDRRLRARREAGPGDPAQRPPRGRRADPDLPRRRLRRGARAPARGRDRAHPRARDPARAVRELPRAGRAARRDLRAHAARRGRRASTAASTTDARPRYARASRRNGGTVRSVKEFFETNARAGPGREHGRHHQLLPLRDQGRRHVARRRRRREGDRDRGRGRGRRAHRACPRRSSASSSPGSRTRSPA